MPARNDQQQVQLIVQGIALGFDEVKKQLKSVSDSLDKVNKKGAGNNLAPDEKTIGQFTQLKESVKGFLLPFTELRSAIMLGQMALQTFMRVAEGAFNFAKQGAQVEQMKESWKGFIEYVGAAPDTLDKVREAARGTVDDVSMMSAVTLLAAGATKTFAKMLFDVSPKLMEIAKAASILNPQLGDVEFMFNSIAKGIKRTSPLILDNLGIIVRQKQAHEEYAASIGKTVDQLGAEERKIALLTAVLKIGDEMINQVGGSTESAVDPFNQLTSSITNLGNEMKQATVAGIQPFVEGLNGLVGAYTRYVAARNIVNQAEKAGQISNLQATEILTKLNWTSVDAAEALQMLSDAVSANSMNMLVANNTYQTSAQMLEYLGQKAVEAGSKIGTVEDAWYAMVLANKSGEGFQGYITGEQFDVLREKIRLTSTSLDDYREKIAEIMIASGGANAKKMADIIPLDYDKQGGFIKFLDDIRAFNAGMSAEQMGLNNAQYSRLAEAIKELGNEAAKQSGVVDQTAASWQQYQDAMAQAIPGSSEQIELMKRLADAHRDVISQLMQAAMLTGGLSAGLSGEYSKALESTAEKLAKNGDEYGELIREYKIYEDIVLGQQKPAIKELNTEYQALLKEQQKMKKDGIDVTSDAWMENKRRIGEVASDLKQYTTKLPAASDKLGDLSDKLDKNRDAYYDLQDAIKQTTLEMIYQQAAAGLTTEASLDIARAFGLISEQDYALGAATAGIRAYFDQWADADGNLPADVAMKYAQAIKAMGSAVTAFAPAGIEVNLENIWKAYDNIIAGLPPLTGFKVEPDFSEMSADEIRIAMMGLLEGKDLGLDFSFTDLVDMRPDGAKWDTTKKEWEAILGEFDDLFKASDREATQPTIMGGQFQAAGEALQPLADALDSATLGIQGLGTASGTTAPLIAPISDSLEDIGENAPEAASGVDAMTTAFGGITAPVESASTQIERFNTAVSAMQSKTITVNVVTVKTPGFAKGVDMVVPPGYPNDSFPMFVSSGERVQVTPFGKKAKSGGAASYASIVPNKQAVSYQTTSQFVSNNQTVMNVYENHFHDAGSAALALAAQGQARRYRVGRSI